MFREQEGLLRELSKSILGLDLTDRQVDQFLLFGKLLLDWNEKMNLTSITDPQEVVVKHFLDSMTLVRFTNGVKVADIGTGAGFPGIPLKIVCPDLEIFLIDSLAKRLEFLRVVISELDLVKTEVVHARAEDLGRDKFYRGTFDTVTSRAVAKLPVLLEYAVPLLKVNGVFLAAKGSQVDEEVEESMKALGILGAQLKGIEKFNLGIGAEHRAIVIVEKIKDTPLQYPRKAGTPVKKPLV